ncbi:MAG: ABC transporter substrate-binding protein [Anaerolineae bacterium]|nr:ABC transporter substrate-binding protein [Anaerolineae bacterium]
MLSYNKLRSMLTILILAALFALLLSGCGTSTPKVYHVGILGVPSFPDATAGFKAKMAELGYVEGKNIVYDEQKFDPATSEGILKKFIADKVDMIFAYSTASALAAKAATQGTNIPVIFALATLEQSNLVESQRNPGGNLTGARFPAPEITVKRFELLHEIMPQLKRLYVTYDAKYPTAKSVLGALRPAVEAAGVTLVEEQITKAEDIPANLQARAASDDIGMDAILILPETLSQSAVGYGAISEFAAAHHVPVVGNIFSQVQQGALFIFAPAVIDGGKLAALQADKVFKGTPAGTLPVLTPESALVINYNVAQQLGITVPEGLLKQAMQIIR